jgi:hypothetical protein
MNEQERLAKQDERTRYYLEQMQKDFQNIQQEQHDFAHGQMSIFGNEETKENLVKWQLDFGEDLDRIYHLLKGHQLKYDERTRQYYHKAPDDPNLVPFNEYGVQLIMNIIEFYLNRNTILSNYKEDMINWKVLDFGNDLADLIFNRYEDMMITIDVKSIIKSLTGSEISQMPNGKYVIGMHYDNGQLIYQELSLDILRYIDEIVSNHLYEKIKLYPMIVRELVDTVHSAYLRAFNGGERESLRTARTVHQSEPIMNNYPMNQPYPQQNRSRWYNPMSWGK